tara:strand:- start:145 stop:648 length:504 start_codon:yes stop_codon:yes gene_type:complete
MFIIKKKKYIYNIIMNPNMDLPDMPPLTEITLSGDELEQVLQDNAELNSDNIELIDSPEDLSGLIENYEDMDEKKDKKREVGMMEQIMNFLMDNCCYILIGVLVVVLICGLKKRASGLQGVDDMCDYLETSLDESMTSLNNMMGLEGGAADEETSSLDSMSSTSGTN